MQTKIMLGLTAAACLLLARANAADTYKIDPAHSSLTFSVRHMGINNVKGHFDEFVGSMVTDDGVSHLSNWTWSGGLTTAHGRCCAGCSRRPMCRWFN